VADLDRRFNLSALLLGGVGIPLFLYSLMLVGWTPPPTVQAMTWAIAAAAITGGLAGMLWRSLQTRGVALGSVAVGIVLGVGMWWFVLAVPQVENGGFEESGGSASQPAAWRRYEKHGDPGRVDSVGEVDTRVRRTGSASFRIVHKSLQAPGQVATISQRIPGAKKGQPYLVTFWVQSEGGTEGAVFLTTNKDWNPTSPITGGKYPWTRHEAVAYGQDGGVVELIFVAQAPAYIWIDDVSIERIRN
jgi:hypothetical protein